MLGVFCFKIAEEHLSSPKDFFQKFQCIVTHSEDGSGGEDVYHRLDLVIFLRYFNRRIK